nr:hypothetical protein [Tanacetum cinerariifolium]
MYRPSFDSPSPSLQPNLGLRFGYVRSIEDESPVKEVAPVKAKKVTKRRKISKTTINKEASKPWTTAEEGALCKAWVDVSKNNIKENDQKTRGFWLTLIMKWGERFEDTMPSTPNIKIGMRSVEMVADTWKSIKSANWEKMKEQQESYIQLKNRELDI